MNLLIYFHLIILNFFAICIHEIQLIDEISVSPNGDERHYYLVETYPDMFTASSFPTRSEAKAYVNALKDRGGNEG